MVKLKTLCRLISQLDFSEIFILLAIKLIKLDWKGKKWNSKIDIYNTTYNILFRAIHEKWPVVKGGKCNIFELTLDPGKTPVKFCLKRFTSDYKVFGQLVLDKQYIRLMELQNQRKFEIKTILDIGANVGISAVLLNHYFPDANIYAIEPVKINIDTMRQNLKINRIESKVCIIEGAFWYRDENLKIKGDFRDAENWSYQVERNNNNALGIKAITIESLHTYYHTGKFDIIKVDIEGAEKYIFEDKELTKKILNNTLIFTIEIHDEIASRGKIIENVSALNFKIESAGDCLIAYK